MGFESTVLSKTMYIGDNFSTKTWYWGIKICKVLYILYVLLDAKQNKKDPSFFQAFHPPRNSAIALGVTPWGPKYAQQPWKGGDLPQASEMGRSF